MKLGKTGRWLITAFGVFLGLLVIWVLAVLQLNPAGAGVLNLGFDVRSRLPADYGPDTASRQVGVLRFTIIGDVMRELGMGPEEAEGYAQGMQVAMTGPVPTATARDFSGADPFTPTPTLTPIPTDTPEPTATPIPTRRPTHTPRPTQAHAPTAAAVTAAPTATGDTEAPEICCFETEPGPGPLITCTILVEDLEVRDPAFSSGISDSDVQFKYRDPNTGSYVWFPATLVTGGFVSGPGSEWHAHYAGSLTIGGVTVSALPPGTLAHLASVVDRPRATGVVTIEVFARVVDNDGYTTYSAPLSFDLTTSCP